MRRIATLNDNEDEDPGSSIATPSRLHKPVELFREFVCVRRGAMKAEELFRNVPANIHELYLALAGLPKPFEVPDLFR